ncbi:MAG: TIGR04211 family SH3 domain-containing protein [Deltaproteobacteria bacterium]|jgi:SH3 domain protein|nr:TIGR04211 family SH3 domain-containing protein [Deltaproteobacteria bacterium]MBW2573663.1 TIGR04211 family SH3 domain-containing protein [Deltaproteobacteria bacterium]MBW2670241.1 TIGR04211 family SH3 domain-containing protein [Deltaproteobacteria bacterium]
MSNITARKTMSMFLFIFAIILAATIKSVFADTRYVSDELIISVRDGQNQDDNVLRYIKTGTAVNVLEEKGRYLRIKTEDGLEGWVQTQYIISEKPNARIIEDLRNEINEQDALSDKLLAKKTINEIRIRELKQEVNINQENTAKAKSELIELNKKYKKLLSNSETTDELITKLEKSKQLDSKLQAEISNLKKGSQNPLKSSMIQPFLAGAGVLIVGFILGRLARRRKRSKFY